MTPKNRILALLPAALGLTLALTFATPAAAQDKSADSTQDAGEDGAAADGDGEVAEGEADTSATPSLRRGNRMEFDARLIRGESAGSGAVFLFQRAQRPLPSMINKRNSFLRDTVDTLLGAQWAEKFDEAQTKNAQTD
ncbi:hypothetical protein [Bradymonas sediminis]|nr:hypothetical protein [Bradymonas sediminis]